MAAVGYRKLTCFFLSGTGNSYRSARWLVEDAESRGIEAETIAVDRARPLPREELGSDRLFGFYFPTHGFMPPWSMLKFLLRVRTARGSHAAVVATRGGIKIGPVIVPGAAGLAVFLATLLLALKGYRVRAGLSVDMPANMLNLHWGMLAKNVAAILARGRGRHQKLAEAVLSGRRYWSPANLLWEALWGGAILTWWPAFPILYLAIGRLFMAKVFFADGSCKGCGKCARDCPNHAIIMVGRSHPRVPFWTRHCEACMRCMAFCDFRAVQASHLWAVVLGYATTFFTASLVQRWFAAATGVDAPFGSFSAEVAAVILIYVAYLVAYDVFWALTRVPPLRAAFSLLTPTRYFRRYHEPATDKRELTGRRRPRPDQG
jgi:ferredoxin